MTYFSSVRFAASALLIGTIALISFQNCSQFSALNDSGTMGLNSKGDSKLTVQAAIRSDLVLRPADHPDLVQHRPISAGLFTDGPINPWKDDAGNTYINVPHSENYRYLIGNSSSTTNPWSTPNSWTIEKDSIFDSRQDYVANGNTYHRGGNCSETDYDNRIWLFGFWSFGKTVAAVAHHEWYSNCANGYNTLNDGNPTTFNTHWVNAISHLVSQDGGRTFLPKALKSGSNSDRLVLIPEPKSVQNPAIMYGFFHPSNIVKEGDFYYATAEMRDFVGQRNSKGREVMTGGFILIRTRNVTQATGWEVYDAQKNWSALAGYQGNKGQKPHIFFPMVTDPYETANNAGAIAMNLRYHMDSKQWLAFGAYNGRYTILKTASLSVPQFEENGIQNIEGMEASYPYYISVFDPNQYNDPSDLNYVNIGSRLMMLHMKGYEGYAIYDLTIKVEAVPSTPQPEPTPAPTPAPTPGIVDSAAPAVIPAGYFMNGVNLYYSNGAKYCYVPSMEFYTAVAGTSSVDSAKRYSSMPSGMTQAMNCFVIPAGVFKKGYGLYYSNGGAYCYFPNMELYTARTGRVDAVGILEVQELPIMMADHGACE